MQYTLFVHHRNLRYSDDLAFNEKIPSGAVSVGAPSVQKFKHFSGLNAVNDKVGTKGTVAVNNNDQQESSQKGFATRVCCR